MGGTGRAEAEGRARTRGASPSLCPSFEGEDPSAPSPLAGRATSADVAGPTDVGSRTEVATPTDDAPAAASISRMDRMYPDLESLLDFLVLHRIKIPRIVSPSCSPSRPTARRPTACWRRPAPSRPRSASPGRASSSSLARSRSTCSDWPFQTIGLLSPSHRPRLSLQVQPVPTPARREIAPGRSIPIMKKSRWYLQE